MKLDFKREYKLYETPPANTKKQEWKSFIEGQWDELIKDIIALTNGNVGTSSQEGKLIIGADDKLPFNGMRQIYDTADLKINNQQLLSRVNSACNPPIPDILVERIVLDGKQLFVITIPPSPHVHETSRPLTTTTGEFDDTGALRYFKTQGYTDRTAFVRRGEDIFPATDDERKAISSEKKQIETQSKTNLARQRDLGTLRLLFENLTVVWRIFAACTFKT